MSIVNWSNVTDFDQIPAQANTASAGYFWPSMMTMIWVIFIILLSGYGWEIALMVATFLAFVISIILVYADLVPISFLLFYVAIEIFMIIYIMWRKK